MSVTVQTIANVLDINVSEVPLTPSGPATLEQHDPDYLAFWQVAFEQAEASIPGFETASLLAGYFSAPVDAAMHYVSSMESLRRSR